MCYHSLFKCLLINAVEDVLTFHIELCLLMRYGNVNDLLNELTLQMMSGFNDPSRELYKVFFYILKRFSTYLMDKNGSLKNHPLKVFFSKLFFYSLF